MSLIDQLAEDFARLPGIGPKTALRLVYHLMKGSPDDARRLARSIRDVADRIRPCTRCGNFTEHDLCSVCTDARRDPSVICVVEEAYEVGAIERTGRYRGLYHVLGGRLSPLDGVGPDQLAVRGLVERIRASAADAGREVLEVIVATNASVEGEATAVYLEGVVRPLGPRETRHARGIPVGSDLEYVDGSTLAEALSGRREM
jgi:recombination protein RecR